LTTSQFGMRLGLVAAAMGAMLLCACSGSTASFLDPKSQSAAGYSRLSWIFLLAGGIIFLAVIALLLFGAFRRPAATQQSDSHRTGTALIWIGGIAIPIVVLGTVFGLSIANMAAYSGQPSADISIDVIAHQWWWEVRYPNDKVVTANEIHIPVGESARVSVTSADAMHAFWVPQLQGKIDAVPGHTNTITLTSSSTGTFRGECLVYCGLQHANMNFIVVVDSISDYRTWLASESATPAPPTDAELVHGQQVFLGSACVYCHTVAGSNASGKVGPDLTHIASRQQLGAGAISNTPGSLGGWIVDPQTIKPGNMMPPENFNGSDLQVLIAYLESLK
jgi:cytochrome c oxidase subunit 2